MPESPMGEGVSPVSRKVLDACDKAERIAKASSHHYCERDICAADVIQMVRAAIESEELDKDRFADPEKIRRTVIRYSHVLRDTGGTVLATDVARNLIDIVETGDTHA